MVIAVHGVILVAFLPGSC